MALHYNKPPLSIDDQAQLLLSRGLVCSDVSKLARYLASIGYYRLSAYWLPFEKPSTNTSRNHQFYPGTDFEQILHLYIFDRKLRLLFIEAIELIEVALRSHWSGLLALEAGDSHVYMNPAHFNCSRQHIQNLAKFERDYDKSREVFILHYKGNYTTPQLPPVWAIVETMTLGELSRWYSNTKICPAKTRISKAFGMPTVELAETVFHALTPIRNICAHHSRLWNRKFPISLPNIKRFNTSLLPTNSPNQQNHYLYNYLVITLILMNAINPSSSWKNRLIDLLNTVDQKTHTAMGFPADWRGRPVWQ